MVDVLSPVSVSTGRAIQSQALSASPSPCPCPSPPPDLQKVSSHDNLPSIHYLNGGIPVLVPAGGMVETYDHREVLSDKCTDPPVLVQNGIDTSYPERGGELEEGGSLFDVARVWEEKIDGFLEQRPRDEVLRDVQRQVKVSLGVVQEALSRWRSEELAMSFNGGKDCLVMLILFLAALSKYYRANPTQRPPTFTTTPTTTGQTTGAKKNPPTIPCVYVMSTSPFPEVDNFVSTCVHTYHLTVHRYPLPMKTAFATYLSAHPQVKMIFVGTRRTDPHGEFLGHFDPTDGGWPPFVRCQPVIDWHYREIWGFLRELEVPYCSLYDQGYTSLGGTTDTQPNPKLVLGEDGIAGHDVKFRPAYELMHDAEERLGRD